MPITHTGWPFFIAAHSVHPAVPLFRRPTAGKAPLNIEVYARADQRENEFGVVDGTDSIVKEKNQCANCAMTDFRRTITGGAIS